MIEHHYDDGGRAAAGFVGEAGDCATRAIAIAAQRDYREVYDTINAVARASRGRGRKSNARTGVYRETVNRALEVLGIEAEWVPTMAIGQGCTVHVRADELPAGRLIVRVTAHFAAVVDGVLRDTQDCSRDGMRCVYGYWRVA